MNPWIDTTGWTLIHFVWQGTLLALATAAALWLCRRSAPQVRYIIACLGLVAMLGTVAATALASAFPVSVISFTTDRLPPGVRFEPVNDAAKSPVSQQAVPAPVAARAWDAGRFLPAIVWVWLAGVTMLIARLAGGCWRVHRLRTAATLAPLSSWQSTAERLARRLRVGVPFRVIESAVVDTPILIGWLKPLVVLPLAALANMTAAQVEALIAHELAHIRRRDYAINLLQTVAEALLFFHPGVWWISRRIRQEREHCCDDAAIGIVGEPAAYAEALMTLASWRQREWQPSLGAAQGSLLLRVRRLLNVDPEDEAPGRGGLAVLGAGVALAATVMVLSAASSATAQPTPANGESRRVRQTDHFEIHYPPSLDLHADRVAIEAERAYERVSGDLRHNLGFNVPLVLFESGADLQRGANAAPGGSGKGDRILFAVDSPADQWLGLITHEVAHVFAFDILPGNGTPAWISEGLAEYQRNAWDPSDLVMLREAVRTNAVPRVTTILSDSASERAAEVFGHAAFDFIESRWGKAGMRQFLVALRRSGSGGGDPYDAAFRMPAAEFDGAFESYLRARLNQSGAAAPAREPAPGPTVQVEGVITTITTSAPAHLACIELLVPVASGNEERWAIECGEARADDVVRSLEPGQRVVVTGIRSAARGARRVVIRSLVRQSDGFTWRLPA